MPLRTPDNAARWLLAALVILWIPKALACGTPIGGERAAVKADRAEQRILVAELTTQADTIVIATTEHIQNKSGQAFVQFRVKEAIKGTPMVGDLLTYELTGMVTIGCTTAAAFNNTWGKEGMDFVVYAQDGNLLRTGAMKREWPEISSKEEISRIRKHLTLRH